jgi:ribA/ribD-fused uncharacterized protein
MQSGQDRPGALSVYQISAILKKIKNKPGLFDINVNGDIVIKNTAGDIVQTIPIGPYRSLTADEVKDMEDKRWENIAAAEEKYEAAAETLRNMEDQYRLGQISASSLMRAGIAMETADRQRNSARYGIRNVVQNDGTYEVRKILFNEKYEVRKMPHPLYFSKSRSHTLQNQYVRYGHPDIEEEGTETISEEEESDAPVMSVAREEGIIVFGGAEENENGFLASDFPAEFTLNGVRYFTVDQVIAAEKARIYRNDDMRIKIMKSRSTKMMRVYAEMLDKKAPAQGLEGAAVAEAALAAMDGPRPEAAEWAQQRNKILEAATFAKFKQNPALEAKLLETGNKIIIFADARNKVDGIGLPLSDGRVTDQAAWKGENQLGKILLSVRSRLRGMTDSDEMTGAAGTEEVTESTITKEEYDEKLKSSARLGAILAARRAAASRRA